MANIKVDAMESGSGEGIGINLKKWFKPKNSVHKPSKRLEINNILLFHFYSLLLKITHKNSIYELLNYTILMQVFS